MFQLIMSIFSSHTLCDLADEFCREGGEYLFIDEIHKYTGWAQELKQIYDTHVDLKVAFTGSSVLDIIQGEADLSRRAPVYHYRGFLSESIWRCLRALSSQLIV